MKTVLADYRESKIFNFCDVAQIKAIEWVHRYYLVLLTSQLFDFLFVFKHRWPDVAYACSSASSQYLSSICSEATHTHKTKFRHKTKYFRTSFAKKRFYENRQTSLKSHKVAQYLHEKADFARYRKTKIFPFSTFLTKQYHPQVAKLYQICARTLPVIGIMYSITKNYIWMGFEKKWIFLKTTN